MDRRGFLARFCVALGASGLVAGCGGDAGSNVPEEKVITPERSEDMLKDLEAGRKGMGKPK